MRFSILAQFSRHMTNLKFCDSLVVALLAYVSSLLYKERFPPLKNTTMIGTPYPKLDTAREGCLEDKEFFGCLPSPTMNSLPTSHPAFDGSEDNLSLDQKMDTCIGKSALLSTRKDLLPAFEECLDPTTANLPSQIKRQTMFGKKTQPFLELDLNWEPNQLTPPIQLTGNVRVTLGKMYGTVLDQGNWKTFRPSFELKVTGPYARLRRTMQLLDSLAEPAEFFGVLQVLERVTGPGKKPEAMLIANLHEPSFGTVTEIRRMLLWTSFEELSTLGISSLGSTSILSHWKLRAPLSRPRGKKSGSAPTSTPVTGSEIWTTKPMKHLSED